MPYEQERASRIGHVPSVLSPAVSDAMSRWLVPALSSAEPEEITSRVTPLGDLPGDDRPEPSYSLAFDGSNQEVEARPGYPSIRVGYMQIAGVYVDLLRFLSANSSGLVDPRELERAQITQTVNSVLPGSNVYLPSMTGVSTWREELSRSFAESSITDFGGRFSLLNALLTLHGGPGAAAQGIPLSKCPSCGSTANTLSEDGGRCAESGCGAQLYLTDVLRLHEEYAEEGENILILTRAMNIAERLLQLAYIDGFFRHDAARLGHGLFITDGPLAVYGPVAPMKSQFMSYWGALTHRLEERDLPAPLVVGIEKSGRFVDHANAISDRVPPGHVMMLDTAYINDHIVNRPADHYYGKDEFYGRRFIYRTTSGETLVVTVPRARGAIPYERPRGSGPQPSETFGEYPTLRSTLAALDALQSRMYPNAVIPVALAHSASSLPLGTGRSVLTLLAQQQLGMPHDSISISRFKPPRFSGRPRTR